MKYCLRLLAICLLATSLAGCTNSPTLLKALYGQFDNVLRKEMLSYADFTDAQEERINEAVDATVYWHRTEALPSYAALMREAQARLIDREPVEEDINWLFEQGLEAARQFEAESPVLALLETIRNLSDDQVEQVEEKLNDEFEEQREELAERAEKGAAEESTKGFSKFMRRLGLRLTDAQRESVKASFSQRQLSEELRMQAWEGWTEQLIELLKVRQENSFEGRFLAHYTGRMTLVQSTYPDRWQHDHDLTGAMLLQLFSSLDDAQKAGMRERIALLSGVALDLANEP